MNASSEKRRIYGFPISICSEESVGSAVVNLATQRKSAYICFANVHSFATYHDDAGFRESIEDAELVCPDGAPIAWASSWHFTGKQKRVAGPDVMSRLLAMSNQQLKFFLYGSTEETLAELKDRIYRYHPNTNVVGSFSPPFRDLRDEEEREIIALINSSEANIVLVGLGCPKQEIWMRRTSPQVRGVMLGVGAAFDYHAGNIRRPPIWVRHLGLEWLFRLFTEPRRLWKRYLYSNSVFVFFALKEFLKGICKLPRQVDSP